MRPRKREEISSIYIFDEHELYCEIDDFVEPHICQLRGTSIACTIGSLDLMQDICK